MLHNGNLKWFVRGFALTLVLAAAVLYPRIARMQDTGNVDAPIVVQEAGEADSAESNLAVTTQADAPTTFMTDDPQGRVAVPAPAVPDIPNTAAAGQPDEGHMMLAGIDAAQAEAAIAANYTSPLVISAAELTADGFDPDSFFFPFGSGYMRGNSAAYGCLVAPVYLPQGVTVTDMFVTVYDNSNTYNSYVDLRRIGNFDGAGSLMATATTSGVTSSGSIYTVSDSTISNGVVLYPDYSYYVTTCLQSDAVRIYSIRLYYSEP